MSTQKVFLSMKCLSPFSGQSKKNISKRCLLKFLSRVQSVNKCVNAISVLGDMHLRFLCKKYVVLKNK